MSLLDRTYSWNVDVDYYLNRIIPPSPLARLPPQVSRYLGYRKEQKHDVGNVMGAWWSLLGAFCGLVVVAAIFNNTPSIQAQHPPAIIASFGASAVLEYNAIRSPLGQPRNAILGHTFSALVGVAIAKLFLFHPDFEDIKWIAGAIACGTASAVMLLTGTVHPPGGASAVLAVTDPGIKAMGWYFVGLVMWGTTVMVFVGLIINNIQRQFPVYWWTPLDVGHLWRKDEGNTVDAMRALEAKTVPGAESGSDDQNEKPRGTEQIHITWSEISIPDDLSLNPDEIELVQNLRDRLKKRQEVDLQRVPSSQMSTDQTIVTVPTRDTWSNGASPSSP
jgi:hypothetical protein